MDTTDKELLNILQTSFPLSTRPYKEIGELLNISEEEVINRINKLKEDKVIRQISAIFDTKSLGYESSLVAAKVAVENIDKAVEVINAHPGVSHNYLRNHDFNIWFTIAVPPNSSLGLINSIELLGKEAGVESIRPLQTLKLFKIGVKFDMTGKDSITGKEENKTKKEKKQLPPISEEEIEFVKSLQKHLEVIPEPFKRASDELDISQEEVVNEIKKFIENGRMRRFAAVLHHRKAGFKSNAMGVWAIPENEAEEIGEKMASFKAVSHCYLRPKYPDWPYNIFTMVHGQSKEDCEEILAKISEDTGITNRSALYSSKEFKKIRVVYFTQDLIDWENARR
ncbi:MAG: AsnC family transcriptional regulator [Nitrospinae bacterium]|nr:AsnC family transcriptional regulator [Nitrospinota bacterium]